MDPEDRLHDINVTALILDAESHDEMTFWYLIRELVKFLIAIISIICNTLIIYAIIKLKNTHIPKNFYLLNLAVTEIICLILSPYVDFLSIHLLRNKLELATFICITLQLEKCFLFSHYLFYIILLTDWLLNSVSSTEIRIIYNNRYNFFRIVLYVILILVTFYSTMFCFVDWEEVHYFLLDITTSVLIVYVSVLVLVGIYFERFKYTRADCDFSFLVPTFGVICMLPFVLVHYISKYITMAEWLHQGIFGVTEAVRDSTAIVNVYILSKYEVGYGEKFWELMECKIRRPSEVVANAQNNVNCEGSLEEHQEKTYTTKV